MENSGGGLQLPVIDLSSSDRISTAQSIRKACVEFGFFYLKNHGVEEELFKRLFEESRNFFSLPPEEKMKVLRKNHRGYTPLYDENLDPASSSKGDSKESFYVGPLEDTTASNLNQWPPAELLPDYRSTMEEYHKSVVKVGIELISLLALALDLNEDFFEKVGALNPPNPFLRLLHYPGIVESFDQQIYGASAHSDYGMITLLAADNISGLQVCFEKYEQPQVWEDVHHLSGTFIVNIGDMMERWRDGQIAYSGLHCTECCHREESATRPDCIVECLKSCCSESRPARYPPIRSGDYLEERFRVTYGYAS